MKKITSRDNPVLKNISKLIKNSKVRKEKKIFIAEGYRLCRDALLSKVPIEFVCFAQSFSDKYFNECKEFEKSCSAYLIPDVLFSKICDTQNPQGIICGVKMLDKTDDSDKIKISGKIIALENVQDPTNMGTILRTAEALGIDWIVLNPGCCDIYAPKVVRGSMGAIFRQQVMITDNMPSFIRRCNKDGFETFAAVLDDRALRVSDISFPPKTVIVMGNEGNGITSETLAACMNSVIIPMKGKAESLNVAVAAGILIWEMVK